MNKEINADSRITDRLIYHEAVSIRNTLVKQEEGKNRIYKLGTLFKPLNKVELIKVDTIEACGINSDCYIMRTKDKLPRIVETAGGFLVRNITSLDGSTVVTLITDLSFARKLGANDKHGSKEPWAFIRNDYMYFPNVSWPYAKIEAIWEDPDLIDQLNNCDPEELICTPIYEKPFPIPNYLESPLKEILNESIARYYHRLRFDFNNNKNES